MQFTVQQHAAAGPGGNRPLLIGDRYRSFLREVRIQGFEKKSADSSSRKSHFWQAILPKPGESKGKSRVRRVAGENRGTKGATNVRVELGGWLNLPYGIHTTVSLVVEYFDGEEKQAFKVDAAESKGATQILLSGSVDIIADAPVETIRIFCYGVEDKSIWIENFKLEKHKLD